MAENLKYLIKHVAQGDIYNFSKYPYMTGQKFFTDENIFYEDVGTFRCAIVPSKLIVSSSDLENIDISLANNFAILNKSGVYSIYYYNSGGIPQLISGGGSSGWTPPPATTEYQLMEYDGVSDWRVTNEIRINKITNLANSNTYIEFLEPIDENPAYKVKINGKLDAEIDCGGW